MRDYSINYVLYICLILKGCEGSDRRASFPTPFHRLKRQATHLLQGRRAARSDHSFDVNSFSDYQFESTMSTDYNNWQPGEVEEVPPLSDFGFNSDSGDGFDQSTSMQQPIEASVVDKYTKTLPGKAIVALSASVCGSIVGLVLSAVSEFLFCRALCSSLLFVYLININLSFRVTL